jgi:hypothetical protein
LIEIGVTQFTFPEAKVGVSCSDYLAFFDLNPASGKVLRHAFKGILSLTRIVKETEYFVKAES